MSDDRTVHASNRGIEIVRYDKAGKWFIEIPANAGRVGLPAERVPVSIQGAVDQALAWQARGEGRVFVGRRGGRMFDRLLGYLPVSPADTTEAV